MKKLIELREKMAVLATEARAEFDKITDKTPEEEARDIEKRFDAIMADHDKLGEQADRLQKLEGAEDRAAHGDPRRPHGADAEARQQEQRRTPEYKEVFDKAIRFGVQTLDREERSIFASGRSDLTPEERAQSVGVPAAGGYTVPEGFSGKISEAMKAWGPMWDGSIVEEMLTASGNPIPFPTLDDTGNTGIDKAENAAITDDGTDDLDFGAEVLSAYVHTTKIVKVSLELLEDSAFDIEALISRLFGQRLGRLANQRLTTGTGTSQAQGILTGSTLGKTAAGTAALTSDEIMDFLHSVDPAYRDSPKARFMFNDKTLLAIRKLKDGQGNYLWQVGDVRTSEPSMILGKPYSINQAMPDIALSAKPMIFGDLSNYVVRKVGAVKIITLRERYAEFGQVGMVGMKRFDGRLIDPQSVKHFVMASV